MENLSLSFNVVAPLIVYMIVGALLRRAGVVSRESLSQLSSLLFYTAVPALCMDNLRSQDLSTVFSDPFALLIGGGIVLVFLVTFALVPRFSTSPQRRGVLIHSIFRSNDGVFGLAVASLLFGEENMGLMIVCIAITVPIYNALAVFVMEYYRGGKPSVKRILCQLVKNPILIACVLGIGLSLCKLDLPPVLARPLSALGATCAPLGFVALGGMLTFDSLRENRRAITAVSVLRLLVIPVLFLSLFYALGYRGDHMLIVLILFGAPTAMTVFPMACGMNGDRDLAGGIVAVTSTLSLLTIFLFIFLLKQTGVA